MKDSKSVVIFKTRILELYRSKVFYLHVIFFSISLAFQCILILVFKLF